MLKFQINTYTRKGISEILGKIVKFPIGYQHLVFFVYFVVSRLFWVCFFFKVYYLYSKWVINMIMYMCNIAISLLSQHQSIIYTCIMQSKWCKCTYRFDLLGALQIDFKLHPMQHCVLLEIFLFKVIHVRCDICIQYAPLSHFVF